MRGGIRLTDDMDTLALAAAIATGAIGGVFFAFSSFVMPALNRLPAPAAVAAMQAVNVTAVRAPLMLALFGTAALAVVVAVLSPDALRAAGAAAYSLGVIGVTIAGNVPLNNRLAVLDAGSADAAAGWSGFSRPWTRLNTVRTLAALASAVLFGLAAR